SLFYKSYYGGSVFFSKDFTHKPGRFSKCIRTRSNEKNQLDRSSVTLKEYNQTSLKQKKYYESKTSFDNYLGSNDF
ncbi:MAG: hypothetical protein M3Z92_11550, partial [Bacteroidota bacterium]|nr:hypothetical protein [Bacteroidota bacterium]